jgi:pyruvate kinase
MFISKNQTNLINSYFFVCNFIIKIYFVEVIPYVSAIKKIEFFKNNFYISYLLWGVYDENREVHMKADFTKATEETRTAVNQTQIIATLGPATNSPEKIRALFDSGVDTFRLNFSHGTHEEHAKSVAMIRKVEKEIGEPLGILADMQGPKLRIGTFKDDMKIPLEPGQRIRFDLDPAPGDASRVAFLHPEIIAALEPEAQLLMDDGNVAMRIAEKGDGYLVAEVIYGTELSGKKGVNVPDLSRPVEAITQKDKEDIEFALSLGVDWIAQSFVQTADDMREARKIIKGRAKLMAKMEKPSAIENMKAILAEADAIMVARGDLGVEMPQEKVPGLQHALIEAAIAANKPVIVATQMFDSMINNPRPTRAEINDVALAVLQGASGVMLSGETSVGKYPVQAVTLMEKVIQEAERGDLYSRATLDNPPIAPPFTGRQPPAKEKSSDPSMKPPPPVALIFKRTGNHSRRCHPKA